MILDVDIFQFVRADYMVEQHERVSEGTFINLR